MGVRYEGRAPDADSSVVTKKWAEDTVAASVVDATYVNAEVARVVAELNLQSSTYVDAQDALLAKKTAVDAADKLYVATSRLNQPTVTVPAGTDPRTGIGVATPDPAANGALRTAQVPSGLVTDRVARSVVATGTSVLLSGTTTSYSTVARDKRLATVTIPYPGFPYVPLPFGTVLGQGGATPPLGNWVGTEVLGQLTVCPPSGQGDTIYGYGGFSDSYPPIYGQVLPHGASGMTPATRTPVTAPSLTLDLYGSCLRGSGFVFSSVGLSFFVIVVPAN